LRDKLRSVAPEIGRVLMSKIPGGAMVAPLVSKAIKGMVAAHTNTDYAGQDIASMYRC
jgi:hypothetical protein